MRPSWCRSRAGSWTATPLTAEDIGAIAGSPRATSLYAQLVGIVAYPISGLARTLNQLIGGLAIALGQIQEQGLVGQDAPAAEAAPAAEEAPAEEAPAAEEPRRGRRAEAEPAAEEPQPDRGRGRRHARRDFVTT